MRGTWRAGVVAGKAVANAKAQTEAVNRVRLIEAVHEATEW